jgi:hypothetical protein
MALADERAAEELQLEIVEVRIAAFTLSDPLKSTK